MVRRSLSKSQNSPMTFRQTWLLNHTYTWIFVVKAHATAWISVSTPQTSFSLIFWAYCGIENKISTNNYVEWDIYGWKNSYFVYLIHLFHALFHCEKLNYLTVVKCSWNRVLNWIFRCPSWLHNIFAVFHLCIYLQHSRFWENLVYYYLLQQQHVFYHNV